MPSECEVIINNQTPQISRISPFEIIIQAETTPGQFACMHSLGGMGLLWASVFDQQNIWVKKSRPNDRWHTAYFPNKSLTSFVSKDRVFHVSKTGLTMLVNIHGVSCTLEIKTILLPANCCEILP